MPYKTIPLTKGLVAVVDETDHEWLSKIKWHAHYERSSSSFRAYRHVAGTKNKTLQMSTEIMGSRPGYCVDHKNRNTLDNRRENLRWATLQENCRNRIRKTGNLPGVWRNGAGYSSRITIAKGVRKFLGYFKTPEEAHRAYVKATQHFFGEFSAFTNV